MTACSPRFASATVLWALSLWVLPGLVRAQDSIIVPKQEFGKKEEVKAIEWHASGSAGFTLATGNSNVLTLSGGAKASRNDGLNKIALELAGVYALSSLLIDNGAGGLVSTEADITPEQKTTAGFFNGKFRYDRFFTEHNSGYLSIVAGLDRPASKVFFGAAQIGYSRQIIKNAMHELLGEVGVEYDYTRYDTPSPLPAGFNPDLHLAAGRLFLGYTLTLGASTTVGSSVEALINFNPAHIGDREFGFGGATRVIGKVELNTKIWKALSFRAATLLRYDHAPALNSQLKFATDPTSGVILYGGPFKYNQPLDTLTDLSLVVTFL